MWFTINEPGIQSFAGYIIGIFCPGKSFYFKEAGTVLKNLLDAHIEVYQTLKSMPHGDKVKIGLVHQLLKSVPYTPGSLIAEGLSDLLNFGAANTQILNFLKTGKYLYESPGVKIEAENVDAPNSYDFIGINYYSRVVMGNFGPTCYPDEIMTDMDYPIYPQGIYDAIVEVSQLKVPIYITENGIADAKDENRGLFIREYLNAVHAALEDGYDIRGYYYWSLLDNFEWKYGFDKKFGLYKIDHETQERALREGSKVFRDYFKVEKYIPHCKESMLNKFFTLIPAVRYL
jgi:beta-glucosidase